MAGEVVAVLGRSGSGKSTMLRCINLLEKPNSGEITVGGRAAFHAGRAPRGKDLVALRRTVGMLFQGLNVFPHLSVVENVALPMVRSLNVSEEEAVSTALGLWRRSASRTRCSRCRRSSPAASSSAWPWLERWR